jgi:hypothetical protein
MAEPFWTTDKVLTALCGCEVSRWDGNYLLLGLDCRVRPAKEAQRIDGRWVLPMAALEPLLIEHLERMVTYPLHSQLNPIYPLEEET